MNEFHRKYNNWIKENSDLKLFGIWFLLSIAYNFDYGYFGYFIWFFSVGKETLLISRIKTPHTTHKINVKEFRSTSDLLVFFSLFSLTFFLSLSHSICCFFPRLFWCRVRQTRSTSLTTAGNSLRLAYYSVKN